LTIDVVSKDAAYVIGRWHLKRNVDKGNLDGHFTLLLKKINNRWVIVSDHSS
jgi:ketosteroid isomerase-like protein